MWDRLVNSEDSIAKAYGEVYMGDYKRLFGCKLLDRAYCVVSKKGYLIVYKDVTKQIGYAFDLTSAKKTLVSETVNSNGVTVSGICSSSPHYSNYLCI